MMSESRTFEPPPPPRNRRSDGSSAAAGVAAGLRLVKWLAVGLFVLFWCSGITIIPAGEVGLVFRLGKLRGPTRADQVHQPGLLLALPYPIDRVVRVPVKQEREVEINLLRPREGRDPGVRIDPLRDGYALSGDQNILQATLIAKYRIADPVAFTIGTVDPERLLRDVVGSSASQVISESAVDEILRLQRETSGGAEALHEGVSRRASSRLDDLSLGVQITAIEFREIQPVPAVAPAFQAVQSARIEIETKKREAEGFAARAIPEAEGERNTLIQQANRRATGLRTAAEEEIAVFEKLHAEYRSNPRLVWDRIRLEVLERLHATAQFRFVDPDTRLVLPSSAPAPTPIPPAAQP